VKRGQRYPGINVRLAGGRSVRDAGTGVDSCSMREQQTRHRSASRLPLFYCALAPRRFCAHLPATVPAAARTRPSRSGRHWRAGAPGISACTHYLFADKTARASHHYSPAFVMHLSAPLSLVLVALGRLGHGAGTAVCAGAAPPPRCRCAPACLHYARLDSAHR